VKILKLIAAVLFVFLLAACGTNQFHGTWYSDSNLETIVLHEDGKATGGVFFAPAEYVVDGDEIIIAAAGDTMVLTAEEIDGHTVLISESTYFRTCYYKDKSVAENIIQQREQDAAAAKLEEFKEDIVGFWFSYGDGPIEFTETGEYIYFDLDNLEWQVGHYDVKDSESISIVTPDGEKLVTLKINGQRHMSMGPSGQWPETYIRYERYEMHEVTPAALVGSWRERLIITEETITEKGILTDKVWNYELDGNKISMETDDGETKEGVIFLIEGEDILSIEMFFGSRWDTYLKRRD